IETCTCSLRSVFRNGSCSICPLLLIACSAVVVERAPAVPCLATAPASSRRPGCRAMLTVLAPWGCSGIGITTGLELYPEGGAAELERLSKEMFQVSPV